MSLWFPIRNRSILRRCDILKTNQNSGSIAAAIAKLLYQKLVVRSGYIGSELARRSKLSMLVRAYYFLAENLSYRICHFALISGEPNRKILSSSIHFSRGSFLPITILLTLAFLERMLCQKKNLI